MPVDKLKSALSVDQPDKDRREIDLLNSEVYTTKDR